MQNYPYSYSALGLLYYPVQHALFYIRFGRLNTQVSEADALLALVGVCSVAVLVYFLNTTTTKLERLFYLVAFVGLGVPASLVGSVGGGLLGPAGVIVFGVVPVFVILLLTKGILLLLKK